MRIISKFHDYYDSAAGYGIDKSRIYNRVPKQITIPSCKIGFITIDGKDVELFVIGFCGKIYRCVKFAGVMFYDYVILYRAIKHVNRTSMNKYVSYRDDNEMVKKFLNNVPFSEIEVKYLYDFAPLNRIDRLFLKHKEPIFIIQLNNMRLRRIDTMAVNFNPCLKDVEFFKVKDSFTAYQELDRYIHNELCDIDNSKIQPISDRLKLLTHGFDKHSFRKAKRGKK